MITANRMKAIAKKALPEVVIRGYHFAIAFFAAVFCGFPSRKLKVIGVTGTNGKSTTALMIVKILKEAGHKTALSSSIEFEIGGKTWQNRSRMTMPGRFALQKFLRQAVAANCRYAVVEVSSEGIKQHRHRFIDFEAAVITNVTPEHIESHGSFENYLAAKGKLFAACRKIHVSNGDDANYDFFAKFAAAKKYVYGINFGAAADAIDIVRARDAKTFLSGSSFEIDGREFNLKLPGKFNIHNALAAVCVARSQGVGLDICQKALKKMETVSGRMERVLFDPFAVFVDYAVTPDSLEKAYQTIKDGIGAGKLICVLGSCGGGRDRWKRPVMGGLAKQYCDRVIVTNEDPYDEDPEAIIDQIAAAAEGSEKIADRREAIRKALGYAHAGDAVLITGKGCEDSMCVAGGKKITWSDKAAVLEEFSKK